MVVILSNPQAKCCLVLFHFEERRDISKTHDSNFRGHLLVVLVEEEVMKDMINASVPVCAIKHWKQVLEPNADSAGRAELVQQ